jgi:hypothetical protein
MHLGAKMHRASIDSGRLLAATQQYNGILLHLEICDFDLSRFTYI